MLDVADIDPAVALPAELTLDSISLLPYLADPALASQRSYVFSELFAPNGVDSGLPVDLPEDPENHCHEDLGFGGPGSSHLTLCGQVLADGNTAELLLTGAPPLTSAFIIGSLWTAPFPAFGGTIVPIDPVVTTVWTDANGEFLIPVLGSWGDKNLYVQIAVLDPTQPYGIGLSNAILAEFLPTNTKAVRDARYKLIRSMNGGPDEFYDLEVDPFEATELLEVGLTTEQDAAYLDLSAQLDAYVASF